MNIKQTIALGLLSSLALASESFEKQEAGNFTQLETSYGTIKADKDNAAIHHKGHQGKQSLRLLGGDKRRAELTLHEVPTIDVDMSAWAERWTRTAPFAFSITAKGPYGEKEIYQGDKAISVGGFNSQIKARVPAGTTSLVFSSTSPEQTGILLDELFIVPCVPMSHQATEGSTNVWPAMVRLDFNPMLRLDVQTQGGLKPLKVDALTVELSGIPSTGVESVALFSGDHKARPNNKQKLTEVQVGNSTTITLTPAHTLSPGNDYLWLSVKLSPQAPVGGKLTAKVTELKIGGKAVELSGTDTATQRIGYAVSKGGDAVQPTGRKSVNFRIPGMVLTPAGTLLTCTDIRYNHSGDLPADIDMGVARSTDGGQSWGPNEIALAYKDAVDGYKGAGNGDAALLVDESNSRIWMAVLWSHGKHPIWHGEEGSNAPDKVSQFVLTYSDDDGKTWSKAINITDQVKKPEWGVNFQGPGNGICLRDGTLVFPAQYWVNVNGRRTAHCNIVYSKDHGKTWNVSTSPVGNTSEAQVVELENGDIMINSRNEAGGPWRAIATTSDLGATWELHPTHNNDSGLIEPGACQGSIITVPNKGGIKHPLFFSNPANGGSRKDMTLKASADQGTTWPYALLYDERNGAGYSSLAPVDDEHIGVYYEGHDNIYFLKFPYAELFNSKK